MFLYNILLFQIQDITKLYQTSHTPPKLQKAFFSFLSIFLLFLFFFFAIFKSIVRHWNFHQWDLLRWEILKCQVPTLNIMWSSLFKNPSYYDLLLFFFLSQKLHGNSRRIILQKKLNLHWKQNSIFLFWSKVWWAIFFYIEIWSEKT